MSASFNYDGINLEYETFGSGKKAMFAFHGFSNTAEMFRVLEPSLGKKFTIYSFNLPYHGSSSIDGETAAHGIDTLQLEKYFRNFLWHIHHTYFSLLGYSIGGKLALKLVEIFPGEVQEIFLFAPDGIRISPWYRFVTRTRLGNWTYRRLMQHPTRFIGYVNVFAFLRIIHPRTASFVKNALDTREKREMVFGTWMCLRHLDPDIAEVRDVINKKDKIIHLFFGRHDKMIPPYIGKEFARGLKRRNVLHTLEMGHQLVKEQTNDVLEKILSA